jgi:hypothetical protein
MLVDAAEKNLQLLKMKTEASKLKPHYPFIVFTLSDLAALSGAPDSLAYWQLDREDVFLVPQNSAQVKINFKSTSPAGDEPTSGEEGDIKWVASIEDILPGFGKISKDSLIDQPSSGLIKARIHLTEGLLQTAAVGSFNSENVVMQFFPDIRPRPVRQVLARSLSLEIYGVTGNFKIRTKKFSSSADFRELVFRQPASGRLDLKIFNLCPEDLVEDLDKPIVLPEPDFDFGWYYSISEVFPTATPQVLVVPEPVKFKISGGSGGSEPAKCTKAKFSEAGPQAVQKMLTLVRSAGGHV